MGFNNGARLSVPMRNIMGPGPSSTDPEVLKSLSNSVVGYLDPWYLELLEKTADMMREVWRTSQRTFAIAGTGSAGMEAGFVSLAEPGDTVVICSNGFFCERQIIMAERMGLRVVPLRSEWGEPICAEMLEDTLKGHPGVHLVSAIHAETSVGVLNDVGSLAQIAHRHGALFMADCVTSLAGVPLEFDAWGIDYAYSATQKCLAVPPGLSPVALSDVAYDHIVSRKRVPFSWYLDLRLAADYWGKSHKPHHTSPINMVYGLYEGLRLVLEEGLENRWERHAKNAAALRKGIEVLGLEMPINPSWRLDQLTIVKLPHGVDDLQIRSDLLNEFSVEVGRGLGEYAGKVMRIGLMGDSCRIERICGLLEGLETLLHRYGLEVPRNGTAGRAAELFLLDA